MNAKPTMIRGVFAFVIFSAIFLPKVEAQTTGTSTLSMTVAPSASITINTATSVLTTASVFASYVGTTAFTYILRTSQTTGTGTVQLKITSDFSPSGGPSVTTPPTAGDALTYTCTALLGTPCSTTQTASTIVSTPVVTFGADVHSPVAGSTGTVIWSLTNDPVYKSGTYTATATFTISTT